MNISARNVTLTMSKTAKLNETVSTDSLTGLALLSAHRLHYSKRNIHSTCVWGCIVHPNSGNSVGCKHCRAKVLPLKTHAVKRELLSRSVQISVQISAHLYQVKQLENE